MTAHTHAGRDLTRSIRAIRPALASVVLVGSAVACGERSPAHETNATAQNQPAVRLSSPVIDSMRARRSAALAKRPDTLGMRADSGRILGSPDATLWVIVMSDFQCAECREFALRVLPQVRRDFVDKGLVRIAFVNNPQDRNFNARFAAAAALCAAAVGRFWEMHDSLYSQQQVWARRADARPYLDSLAVAAGVPAEVQKDCVARNRMLYRLSVDIEQSRLSRASDVPTVFVGDRRLEPSELTYTGLRSAITQALEGR